MSSPRGTHEGKRDPHMERPIHSTEQPRSGFSIGTRASGVIAGASNRHARPSPPVPDEPIRLPHRDPASVQEPGPKRDRSGSSPCPGRKKLARYDPTSPHSGDPPALAEFEEKPAQPAGVTQLDLFGDRLPKLPNLVEFGVEVKHSGVAFALRKLLTSGRSRSRHCFWGWWAIELALATMPWSEVDEMQLKIMREHVFGALIDQEEQIKVGKKAYESSEIKRGDPSKLNGYQDYEIPEIKSEHAPQRPYTRYRNFRNTTVPDKRNVHYMLWRFRVPLQFHQLMTSKAGHLQDAPIAPEMGGSHETGIMYHDDLRQAVLHARDYETWATHRVWRINLYILQCVAYARKVSQNFVTDPALLRERAECVEGIAKLWQHVTKLFHAAEKLVLEADRNNRAEHARRHNHAGLDTVPASSAHALYNGVEVEYVQEVEKIPELVEWLQTDAQRKDLVGQVIKPAIIVARHCRSGVTAINLELALLPQTPKAHTYLIDLRYELLERLAQQRGEIEEAMVDMYRGKSEAEHPKEYEEFRLVSQDANTSLPIYLFSQLVMPAHTADPVRETRETPHPDGQRHRQPLLWRYKVAVQFDVAMERTPTVRIQRPKAPGLKLGTLRYKKRFPDRSAAVEHAKDYEKRAIKDIDEIIEVLAQCDDHACSPGGIPFR